MNAGAIEFDAAIENGMIRIPGQYKNFPGGNVRVLIFPLDETRTDSIKKRMESADALTGIISDDFDFEVLRKERIIGKV